MGIINKILGGRPMTRTEIPSFRDIVTGEMVNFWVDKNGKQWMALNAWSLFRAEITNPLAFIVNPDFAVITKDNWHDAYVYKLDLIRKYQFAGNRAAMDEVERLGNELEKANER